MNVTEGFETGLASWYSALSPGWAEVYDGLERTGSLLASLDLGVTGSYCGASMYSCSTPVGVPLGGTDPPLSHHPLSGIPDPGSTLLLFGLGLVGLKALQKRFE
jgi:hypothetical protein